MRTGVLFVEGLPLRVLMGSQRENLNLGDSIPETPILHLLPSKTTLIHMFLSPRKVAKKAVPVITPEEKQLADDALWGQGTADEAGSAYTPQLKLEAHVQCI